MISCSSEFQCMAISTLCFGEVRGLLILWDMTFCVLHCAVAKYLKVILTFLALSDFNNQIYFVSRSSTRTCRLTQN